MHALLQGDAFALAVVFQFLYEKKSIHAANFRLVNSQFYGIACKFQHKDFEHLIVRLQGEKYDFPIIIKHANFAKQLRKVTINEGTENMLLLEHFAGQLEKIKSYDRHLLDIKNITVFPKLKSLRLIFLLLDYNAKLVIGNLKAWLSCAPQLETLHLSFSRNNESDATDAIVKEFVSMIAKVPRIKLQLFAIDEKFLVPIQHRIVNLECPISMSESFALGLSSLQHVSIPMDLPWISCSSFWSKMNKLKTLEWHVNFSSAETEQYVLSLLPVSLRKLTLRGNCISFPNIAHLKQLEKFIFAGIVNKFVTPDWFASLCNLTDVSFDCFIRRITITHLPCNLKRLAISKCDFQVDIVPPTLSVVSIEFESLPTNLNMISELSITELNDQEKVDFPFPKLRVLHMTSYIPVMFDQIPQSIVKIEFICKLKTIPVAFCTLPSLEYLNLSNNAIEQLDNSLLDASTGNFANLTHLILKNNKICKYPLQITLPKLQVFIMDTIDANPDSVSIEPAQVARFLYDPIARTELQRMQASYSIRFADIGIAYAIVCRTQLILNVHYGAKIFSILNDIPEESSTKGQVSLLVEPTNGTVHFAMWATINKTMFEPSSPERSWDDYSEENEDDDDYDDQEN